MYQNCVKKETFGWDNKDKKHNPFEVKEFGEKLDVTQKGTSRENGIQQSYLNSMKFDNNTDKAVANSLAKKINTKVKKAKQDLDDSFEDPAGFDNVNYDDPQEDEDVFDSGFDHGYGGVSDYSGPRE